MIYVSILFFFLMLIPSAANCAATQARTVSPGNDLTFKIEVPLEFKGRTVSGTLRKTQISQLLNLPVRNGDTDPRALYGVEMTTPSHKKFMVYTCEEWKKSRAAEDYSATTYDMAMEGYLIRTCGLLFEFQKGKLPVRSFIENPHIGLDNLDSLPAEMLSFIPEGSENGSRLRGFTVAQIVPRKSIEEARKDELILSYGGLRQEFWEAARADFNGDGIEDILVFTSGRAEGGTMGYSDYFVLTRTSASGKLKIIRTEANPLQ
jgi:hypothetical protein